MGHKSVVILDHDHFDLMRRDPAEFVRRLELAALSHRRTGGSVSKATRFVILRGVQVNGYVDLAERPARVCTLINETAFNEDHLLVHNRTVFFEDHLHDWRWTNGRLKYYSRVATVADVVAVYEETEAQARPKFDPTTGAKL